MRVIITLNELIGIAALVILLIMVLACYVIGGINYMIDKIKGALKNGRNKNNAR